MIIYNIIRFNTKSSKMRKLLFNVPNDLAIRIILVSSNQKCASAERLTGNALI